MHKIFFIFFLLFSTAILSQVDEKIINLSEVDSFPVFQQITLKEKDRNNKVLFQAKLQQYIITKMNPKLLNYLENDVRYSLKLKTTFDRKVVLTDADISNNLILQEFKKVVETLEVKSSAKLKNTDVEVTFMLPLKIKFQDIKIIK